MRSRRYRRSSSRADGPFPTLMNLPMNRPSGIEIRNQPRRKRSTFSMDCPLITEGSTEHTAGSAIATILQGGRSVGRVPGSFAGRGEAEGPPERRLSLGPEF